MANWSVATFAVLIVTLLIVLTALILIIIQIVNPALLGGCPTTTAAASATTTATAITTSTDGQPTAIAGGPSSADAFGPGTDGDLSLANQTDIRLYKDAFYRNLTLDNCILQTNGYRLFVSDTLTLLHNPTIRNAGKNGNDNDRASPATGGIGAAAGTLGGGGNGGNGRLDSEGMPNDINGGSTVGGWIESTKPVSNGTGGNSHSKRGGIAGRSNVGSSIRSSYEAISALTPSFLPTKPLLGGGSGGGGGTGQKGYPGSGGGGGGGTILIAAKTLVVSDSATIDASGGAGGSLTKNGPTLSGAASRYPPATASRGGGGGGGTIIVSTLSNRSSYAGLRCVVDGGQSSLFDGRLTAAESGTVVFWHDDVDNLPSAAYISLKQSSSQLLKAGQETTVSFGTVDKQFGINADTAAGSIVVGKTGMYLITAGIELPPVESSSAVRAWIRLNQAKGIHPRIGETAGTVGGRLSLSTVVRLVAGDSFDLRIRAPTDTDLNASLDSATELAAVLLVAG